MYKKRLVAFYKRHNPACLDSVDEILDIFAGREEELLRVLAEKYAGQEEPHEDDGLAAAPPLATSGRHAIAAETAGCVRDRGTKGQTTSMDELCQRLSEALRGKGEEVGMLAARVRTLEARLEEQKGGYSTSSTAPPFLSSDASRGVDFREMQKRIGCCEAEIDELRATNYSLRKDVVVLQAEKEALRRQRRVDEDSMRALRAALRDGERRERRLIEASGALELGSGGPLHEREFLDIIRSSQEQLTAFYEDKMASMEAEMERFYAHTVECIHEKDAIIAALKAERLAD
ncbi:hypothetical protein NESM_000129500 [Novymonas esmeraldas]|uniref:Uncharacterized protein n=1 Tax=Novymonas esmeraldas TaxID=1808958 RepID=A0AAW0F4X7_9TRYP